MSHNKVKKVILLACYIFLLLFYSLLFCASARAQDSGQPALSFTPNVNIGPGFQQGVAQPVNESTLGNYIATWYGFVIGTIGILAAIMIMYGGVKWLTSRGGQAVSDAKDIIFSALIGLTLAFLSYTILNLVNPNLLKLGLPKMGAINYTENFNLVPIEPAKVNSGPLAQSAGLSPAQAKNVSDWISGHEGYRREVYKDKNGNITAGTGHLLRKADGSYNTNETFNVTRNGQPMTVTSADVQPGDIISDDQAYAWFSSDIATFGGYASKNISGFDMLPNEAQSVAIDLTYQWGSSGVSTNFNGFYDALSRKDYNGAANILEGNSAYTGTYGQRATDNINTLRSLASASPGQSH